MDTSATHYPTSAAKCADLVVHIVGLAFALFGGGILLGLAVARGAPGQIGSVAVYAVGMALMLGCSLAYNFGKAPWRPLLRRFDHAGIFLMIAGSYTPFTTQSLTGAWAIGMTAIFYLMKTFHFRRAVWHGHVVAAAAVQYAAVLVGVVLAGAH